MHDFLLAFFTPLGTGVFVPLPEEVVLLGVSVAAGDLARAVPMGLLAMLGLYLRDLSLFLLGRFAGTAVFRWRVVQKMFGGAPLAGLQVMAEEHAVQAVFAGRMAFGVRAVAQLTLGAVGVPVRVHMIVNGLLLSIWVPLLMGLGLFFHEPAVAALEWGGENKLLLIAFAVIIGAAWGTKRLAERHEKASESAEVG